MSITDRLLAITAILPPSLMLWYAESFERRIKEPTQSWRYRVFACAGLATIPIAWLERVAYELTGGASEPAATLLESFLVAATIEETGKFTCLLLLTRGVL